MNRLGAMYGVLRLSPGQPAVLESRGQVYRAREAAVNAVAMARRAEPGITFLLVALWPDPLTDVGPAFAGAGVGPGDVDDRE